MLYFYFQFYNLLKSLFKSLNYKEKLYIAKKQYFQKFILTLNIRFHKDFFFITIKDWIFD